MAFFINKIGTCHCYSYNNAVMERESVLFGVASRMQQGIVRVKTPSLNRKFDSNLYNYFHATFIYTFSIWNSKGVAVNVAICF